MEKSKVLVKLKLVTSSDCRFLYNLLKERNSITDLYSTKPASYKEHVKYVMSKPYTVWYIIEYNGYRAGSINLKDGNKIGIYIKKKMHHKGIGTIALKLLLKKHPLKNYFAHINPKNIRSIQFFKKNGFKYVNKNSVDYKMQLTN